MITRYYYYPPYFSWKNYSSCISRINSIINKNDTDAENIDIFLNKSMDLIKKLRSVNYKMEGIKILRNIIISENEPYVYRYHAFHLIKELNPKFDTSSLEKIVDEIVIASNNPWLVYIHYKQSIHKPLSKEAVDLLSLDPSLCASYVTSIIHNNYKFIDYYSVSTRSAKCRKLMKYNFNILSKINKDVLEVYLKNLPRNEEPTSDDPNPYLVTSYIDNYYYDGNNLLLNLYGNVERTKENRSKLELVDKYLLKSPNYLHYITDEGILNLTEEELDIIAQSPQAILKYTERTKSRFKRGETVIMSSIDPIRNKYLVNIRSKDEIDETKINEL